MYVGIDVASDHVHCVGIDDNARVRISALIGSDELERLGELTEHARVMAVDAPAQLSTAPHADDLTLPPKFRPARCAEIALGREYGCWVPWVTPTERATGWMATGLRIYESLAVLPLPILEVYPYAGYRVLARVLAGGSPLPKKQTGAGVQARVALLTKAGVQVDHALMWSHDGLDALLAALVAFKHSRGLATRVGCNHDDSAIWLPLRGD